MKVVILGGGIAGLLAAYAFRRVKPTVIEVAPKLGGMFTAGGLKYIHDTPDTRKLLRELQLVFTPYTPLGKLWLDGKVLEHPGGMQAMSSLRKHQIQLRHWMKTRGTENGFKSDCMNDPAGSHVALRCDHVELLRRLEVAVREAGCPIHLNSKVAHIDPDNKLDKHVWCNDGSVDLSGEPYDLLITTLPLGMMATLAPWAGLPSSQASKLAIFKLQLPIHMEQRQWDYVYTPNERWFSRLVWPEPSIVMVEVPWALLERDGFSKPDEAMPEVARQLDVTFGLPAKPLESRIIPGHLKPLDRMPIWPHGWHPLGRFAEWDSRATADRVYSRALSLADWHGATR